MCSSMVVGVCFAIDLLLSFVFRFKDGMEWFLGRHQMQGKPAIMDDVKKTEDESEDGEPSAYQRMADIIMSKQVFNPC